MRTVSQSGRLWEESAIGKWCGKVGDRLPFDQDLIVDQIVSGLESDHLHVEGAASSYYVEQRRLMFGVIDIKSVKLTGHCLLPQRHANCVTTLERAGSRRRARIWRGSPRSAVG